MGKWILPSCFFVILFFSTMVVAKTPDEVRQQFIQKMANSGRIVDEAILKNRKRLEIYYLSWKKTGQVSFWDLLWLKSLAKTYQMKDPNFNDQETWHTLLNRVDIIPLSLVIAQAVHESAWGQSRFAKEGNNYFGQYCFTQGCGLVPAQRAPGEIFEVQRFFNLLESVTSYILILNSHNPYRPLRDIRANLRQKNQLISGHALAPGLTYFSENPKYVQVIQNVIKKYDLSKYDQSG